MAGEQGSYQLSAQVMAEAGKPHDGPSVRERPGEVSGWLRPRPTARESRGPPL